LDTLISNSTGVARSNHNKGVDNFSLKTRYWKALVNFYQVIEAALLTQ
jgi:hypothetical protein